MPPEQEATSNIRCEAIARKELLQLLGSCGVVFWGPCFLGPVLLLLFSVLIWVGMHGSRYPKLIIFTPPPLPHSWLKGIFQGRGVGVYILRPRAAGILYAPPLLYTPHP